MENKRKPEDFKISVCGVPIVGLTSEEQEEMKQEQEKRAHAEGFLTYADWIGWVVAHIDDAINSGRFEESENDDLIPVRKVTIESCSFKTAQVIEQKIMNCPNLQLFKGSYNHSKGILKLEIAEEAK